MTALMKHYGICYQQNQALKDGQRWETITVAWAVHLHYEQIEEWRLKEMASMSKAYLAAWYVSAKIRRQYERMLSSNAICI